MTIEDLKQLSPDTLRKLLVELFPESKIVIERIFEMGIDMVSGATLAFFNATPPNGKPQPLMIKVAPGIGRQERAGAELLSRWLPTPDFVGDPADDFSLYEKISGPTIDQLIRQPTMHNFNGSDWYLRTVSEHLQMWKDTLSTNSPACSGSYIGKTNKTTDLALSLSIWSAFLSDVAAKPIVVNKVQLPPLNEMLYAMGRLVGQCKTTVLSHGDEGLCNSILDSAGSRIAYVDVGEAGRRIIGEPIAKLLLWFAATMSEKVKFEYQIIDGVPTIDYRVKLPKEVHEIILKARDIIFSEIGDSIDMPSLYACCMMYLLREIQWISRRQRDIMLAPLFAMAMEAAGAMLGILDELPVFTKSQKTLTTFMV